MAENWCGSHLKPGDEPRILLLRFFFLYVATLTVIVFIPRVTSWDKASRCTVENILYLLALKLN